MALDREFTITQTLGEGTACVLYRGYRKGDPSPVLLKVLRPERANACSIQRLRHEYEIGQRLDTPAVIHSYGLDSYRGRPALLLEDFAGQSLDHYLNGPLEPGRFLDLAIPITWALAEIHRFNVIHKDIKPQNILINPDSGQVKVTDFGIASQLPRQYQAVQNLSLLEGTLAYMSPEQTGRMNRAIDCRTDLYSLGVTFYQMLTGRLPFHATDPVEWVHCHIAGSPPPPVQLLSTVPGALSDMVMKLMAKAAEDRYQTAAGLSVDLENCRTQWATTRAVQPFALGQRDVSDRFQFPQKLYGRQAQIQMLMHAFDRVVHDGLPRLLLVSGYAGIGKSALVLELHKPVVRDHGFFVSGKFDQYQRDIPYSTLAQALRELIGQLLAQSEACMGQWRQRIQAALGQNAQLLVDMVPQLELIIGPQPPVPELPLVEAQNRFQMVFRRFIGVLAAKEHPLALFLDDLQWADLASLSLIQDLLTQPGPLHLLLIGAYRDNEVDHSHPLTVAVEAIRKTRTPVDEIALPPLALPDLCQWIADALRCDRDRTRSLAQLVQSKTGGNPFFVTQFMSLLYQEGMLEFDRQALIWRWDLPRIESQGLTDNVAQLLVRELKRLGPRGQQILQTAACLGNHFNLNTLAIALEQEEEPTQQDLLEPLARGLLRQDGDACSFAHDRVQQAAYSLIPEGERDALHLRTGRRLMAHTPQDQVPERIFQIVNQLNPGMLLLDAPAERCQLAKLNLVAGQKAKACAAYAAASRYLATGMGLLAADAWSGHYDLTYALHLERAECEYLDGSFEVAAQLLAVLVENATTKLDKAAAYRVQVELYTLKGDYSAAVDSAVACVRMLGLDLTKRPGHQRVLEEYAKVWQNLGQRHIEDLMTLPPMTDREMLAAMDVLAAAGPPALFTDQDLVCLLICQAVNLSLVYGNSNASAVGYVAFAMILGPVFGRYQDGQRFGRLACDLARNRDSPGHKARIHFIFAALVNPWTASLQTSLRYLQAALDMAVSSGSLTDVCYCVTHKVAIQLLKGLNLTDISAEIDRGLKLVRKARFLDVLEVLTVIQRLVLDMRGLTENLSTFEGPGFDRTRFEQRLRESRMLGTVFWYHSFTLQARFLSGDYQEALQAGRKATELLWTALGRVVLLEHFYYQALTAAALCGEASPQGRAQYLQLLEGCRQQLRVWAENGAASAASKYALVCAEQARLTGATQEAMRLYDQAIRAAREGDFIQNEAIGHELAGRFYLANGFQTIARAYLREARAGYLRWGADGKARQLQRLYPEFLEEAGLLPLATIGTRAERLDAVSAIKAQQAISGEIVLDRLLQTLMRIVIQSAGAQKGCLLLAHGRHLKVVAESALDRQRVRLPGIPLAEYAALPHSIIRYVRRTHERLIVDNAADRGAGSDDEYLLRVRPKSVLCLPVLRQTHLMAILYVENNLFTHAFTADRLAILELLASQAAISLDSARLYADLRQENAHRRQAEASLAQMLAREQAARNEAETANRAKDEFLATLSHELRTPLTAILGWAQMLRQAHDDPQEVRSGLEIIERNALAQSQIIKDLLDVARIIKGTIELEIQSVDLHAIIRGVIDSIRLAAQARQIELVCCLEEAVGPVRGDHNRLQQVVWNLLTNAVKFTPERGHVEVGLRRHGSRAQIRVKDNGMGINPEFLPHVFERFRQADSSRKRHFGGLGLGLAIVRHLVELHGGAVHADSPGPGQGATFTVELPLLAVAEPQSRSAPVAQAPPTAPPLRGLRVLVVDDEPDTRKLLTAVLGEAGAVTTAGASVAEALELLRSFRPNVLLSDIAMPGEDGYDLARKLRDLPAEQGGRITSLALTAYAGPEEMQRALDAGFQSYLTKPAEPAQLVAAIAQLTGPP